MPLVVKRVIAASMAQTGAEVFLLDRTTLGGDSANSDENASITQSLLYAMATSPQFLAPLRMFSRRRLYANLDNDFLVNPSTGAFLGEELLRSLRQEYVYNARQESAAGGGGGGGGDDDDDDDLLGSGGERCAFFHSPSSSSTRNIVAACNSTATQLDVSASKPSKREDAYSLMRQGLNSLGWEKFVVLFPSRFPYLPLAHNQLPALRKFPDVLFSRVLGCSEGEGVMDHALDFLRGLDTRADQTCPEGG